MEPNPTPPSCKDPISSSLEEKGLTSTFENEASPAAKKVKLTENNSVPDVHNTNDDNMAPTPSPVKAHFTPQENLTFQWKPPKTITDEFINPAEYKYTCANLLLKDAFIDKSTALYNLLVRRFDDNAGDFGFAPLLLVYPENFGKTTLLGFIEAVFSPAPHFDKYQADKVRTKIGALESGKQLCEYGFRSVVRLDMHRMETVQDLETEIKNKLVRAGLAKRTVEQLKRLSFRPVDLLRAGAERLNDEFQTKFGIQRDTIVLIDEYDKPFRDRAIINVFEQNEHDSAVVKEKKRAIVELNKIFDFAADTSITGISLLVLCGLTRMAGLVGFVDISRNIDYHGLCGISANELVTRAKGQLDHDDQALEDFVSKSGLGGFRFGFGKMENLTGADLFSPLDVWEIVGSKLKGTKPVPQWIQTVQSNFDFANFSEKFASSHEGSKELLKTLEEGWVRPTDAKFNLNREQYLLLDNNMCLRKVLFELGLLTVKATDDNNQIQFGPPNEIVKKFAMDLLENKSKQGLNSKRMDRATNDCKYMYCLFSRNSFIFSVVIKSLHNNRPRLVLDKKFEYTIRPLPENFSPPKIEEGQIVEIVRYEDDNWTAPLYIRKHLVKQSENFRLFLKGAKWKLYVTGAPGCGKTCFFWMWAQSLLSQGQKVLFIQYRPSKTNSIWVLENDTTRQLSSPELNERNIADVAHDLVSSEQTKFDVCICDGVRIDDANAEFLKGTLDRLSGKKASAKITKLVIVTSLQFRVPPGQELPGDYGVFEEMSFDSWQEEDYQKAAASGLLDWERVYLILHKDWKIFTHALDVEDQNVAVNNRLVDDQLLEVIRQKYEYVGGSARLMFEMNVDAAKKTLDDAFNAVADPTEFTHATLAGKPTNAVNSLMQQFSDEQDVCIPVSKYVLNQAYERCREQLTAAIRKVAATSNNALLKGWAFELSQLDVIRAALDANLSVTEASLRTQ
jgi:hypothetical protein